MTKRVYVDTSVVSAVLDKDEARRHQTVRFWDSVRNGEIIAVVSDVSRDELDGAPEYVQKFFASIPEVQIERVVSTDESDVLARQYIAEKVVGQSSLNDCRHIAIATVVRTDGVVSWNLKDMVKRQDGYNSVNEKMGYPKIEIQTPKDM